MSKKILSVMLALVMVLSVFSISAFAGVSSSYEKIDEEAGETQIAYTQKWSLVTANEPDANGYYTVDVVLETNYNTGVISFDIVADGATLVDAVAGSAITYTADVAFFEGMEHVDIIPNPTLAQAAVDAPIFAAGSVIATLTYELADGASSATLKLMNDSKCAENQGGTLFAVRLDNKTLASNSVHYGQRVIDAEGNDIAIGAEIASVTLGQEAAEPADLALTATGEANGVVIDTTKTFGGAYAGVVYGFKQVAANTFMTNVYLNNNLTATNGGTCAFARADGKTSGGFGTGSTVTVKNADGSVSKVYVVVIFGDVTSDGLINSADLTQVVAGSKSATYFPNNSVKKLAANTYVVVKQGAILHNVQGNDVTPLKTHTRGNAYWLNQANIANVHATTTTTFYK